MTRAEDSLFDFLAECDARRAAARLPAPLPSPCVALMGYDPERAARKPPPITLAAAPDFALDADDESPAAASGLVGRYEHRCAVCARDFRSDNAAQECCSVRCRGLLRSHRWREERRRAGAEFNEALVADTTRRGRKQR